MSPHLTAAEIASMRADVLDTTLDMLCDIQRNTPGAVDDHGQTGPGTWATIASNLPCHYWETDEEELVGQPNNATLSKERLLLEHDVDVSNKDRIVNVRGYDGSVVAASLDIREVLHRDFDTLLNVRAIE